MTEKTLKHELYKHGSYLISLKESGSEFVNIDDEIKKNEELFQMASKKDFQPDLNIENNNDNPTPWSQITTDHQPAFAVGEYYVYSSTVYKVTKIDEYIDTKDVKLHVLALDGGDICEDAFELEYPFKDDKPATAEQIATFQRAEHFASKGRKLGEFRVGDLVLIGGDKVCVKNISPDDWLTAVNKNGGYKMRKNDSHRITLIQTAEELQEVGDES